VLFIGLPFARECKLTLLLFFAKRFLSLKRAICEERPELPRKAVAVPPDFLAQHNRLSQLAVHAYRFRFRNQASRRKRASLIAVPLTSKAISYRPEAVSRHCARSFNSRVHQGECLVVLIVFACFDDAFQRSRTCSEGACGNVAE